jgi:chain length determinant protein tyrosine kinase EpsG
MNIDALDVPAEAHLAEQARAATAAVPSQEELLGHGLGLDAAKVQKVLAHQKERGGRFGEAAVALGFATEQQVAEVLSRQYRYAHGGANGLRHADLIVANEPFSAGAEVFRSIRAQLKLRSAGAATRPAIAVLSAERGEGKSYFAANLAVAFSQLGERTLLIDANLRSPRQQSLFAVDESSGLSNVLAARSESHAVLPVQGLPNLFVLPVGPVPPNPLELVESGRFAAMLAMVSANFDHVVVDTPAFCDGMDCAVIAATCRLALIVVRRDRTAMNGVQDLVAALSRSPAEVAGVVLNDF